MPDLRPLSAYEQAHLETIEQQLRDEAPTLDHALAVGALHGWRSPPRAWRSRSAWPVTVLAGVGLLLAAAGITRTDVVLLAAGTYAVVFSGLGLWLPFGHRGPGAGSR